MFELVLGCSWFIWGGGNGRVLLFCWGEGVWFSYDKRLRVGYEVVWMDWGGVKGLWYLR